MYYDKEKHFKNAFVIGSGILNFLRIKTGAYEIMHLFSLVVFTLLQFCYSIPQGHSSL